MSDNVTPSYKLRDVNRVNYRETSSDSSFGEGDTLLNNSKDLDTSLIDISSAVSGETVPCCSTPIDDNTRYCSTSSDFGPFTGITSVEDLAGSELASVDDDLTVTTQRLSLLSVCGGSPQLEIPLSVERTDLLVSESRSAPSVATVDDRISTAISNVIYVQSYVNESNSSSIARSSVDQVADDVLVTPVVGVSHVVSDDVIVNSQVQSVDDVEGDPPLVLTSPTEISGMASVQLRRLVADLETIMFQIDELHEGMDTLQGLSYNTKSQTLNELKELRVSLLKTKKEFDFTEGREQYDYDEKFQKLMALAKADINFLRSELSSVDSSHEKVQLELEANKRWEMERKHAERLSKANTFNRSVTDIQSMYNALCKNYSVVNMERTRESMLRRDRDKSRISAEFSRMRDRVDKLTVQSDVLVENKEATLDRLAKWVSDVEKLKNQYEKRVYQDLVDNDLTPDKLKLAESTKMNFGKFSGDLSKGDDFYTFKSKFLKAYVNHPKDVQVDALKNNHLEGLAKEFVGSLENIDEIWERLKMNFGNTEVMLKFHFGKINKMGLMRTFKSYDVKKTYVQTLINSMKDVIDLAKEHNLIGDVVYGPQLGKVVGLLENHYQNDWYKILSEENVEKPQRWERMIAFLNSKLNILQLRVAEAELNDSPSPGSSGFDKSKDTSTKGKGGGLNGLQKVNVAKELCTLCDNVHTNPNTNFVNCKRFLLMSCKNRGNLVRKQKHCLQCLDGRTKFNDPAHECCDKWLCKNEAHARFDKKLHFLICGPHVEDEGNKLLFQEFKAEVLTADWQKKLFENNGYCVRQHAYLEKDNNNNNKTLDNTTLDNKNNKK